MSPSHNTGHTFGGWRAHLLAVRTDVIRHISPVLDQLTEAKGSADATRRVVNDVLIDGATILGLLRPGDDVEIDSRWAMEVTLRAAALTAYARTNAMWQHCQAMARAIEPLVPDSWTTLVDALEIKGFPRTQNAANAAGAQATQPSADLVRVTTERDRFASELRAAEAKAAAAQRDHEQALAKKAERIVAITKERDTCMATIRSRNQAIDELRAAALTAAPANVPEDCFALEAERDQYRGLYEACHATQEVQAQKLRTLQTALEAAHAAANEAADARLRSLATVETHLAAAERTATERTALTRAIERQLHRTRRWLVLSVASTFTVTFLYVIGG